MALIHLMYVSSAVEKHGDDVLEAIWASSVAHNQANGVSGMLLYSDGNFMQVIEGEAAAVDETYRRICADPRHHQLILIVREEIPEREFPDWGMGFRKLGADDARAHPRYAPYFFGGFDAGKIAAEKGMAALLLDIFRNNG